MPDGTPVTIDAPGGGTVTFYHDYKSPNSDALVAATKAILSNAAFADGRIDVNALGARLAFRGKMPMR